MAARKKQAHRRSKPHWSQAEVSEKGQQTLRDGLEGIVKSLGLIYKSRSGKTTKPYVANEQDRKAVAMMSGCGLSYKIIAHILGIDINTLQDHYRHELDVSASIRNTAVAHGMFQLALSGHFPAMAFWLKARAGWRTVDTYQDTLPPPAPTAKSRVDYSRLSSEELRTLLALSEKALVPVIDVGEPNGNHKQLEPPPEPPEDTLDSEVDDYVNS